MIEIALDARPLQGGDRDRGVGTYVRTLLDPDRVGPLVLWADGEEVDLRPDARVLTVPGCPRSGRLGWLRDSSVSSVALRSVPVHVPTLNASFGLRPPVVTVHDAIPWRFPALYPAGRLGALRRRVEAGIARRAARVITGSVVSADDLVNTLGVPAGRIEVIPYCGDPGWAPSTDAETDALRERLSLARRYVVASGGFAHRDPRKRLEDAVDALAAVPSDVQLAVTGRDGPFAAALQARARAAGVSERVRFTGQLSRADLNALFRGACAFVFPSLWEGFGLPLLDAFRSGVPAVVSTGGSLPEVAGGAALVHGVGDVGGLARHLRSILEDPGVASDLRARGLARAADFNQSNVRAAHREIYASL